MAVASEHAAAGRRFRYVRASRVDLTNARQLKGLRELRLDHIFADVESETDINRTELKRMLRHVREGDAVYMWSMDRLGRTLQELQHLVDGLNERGVSVHFCLEKLTIDRSTGFMGRFTPEMLGALLEFAQEDA